MLVFVLLGFALHAWRLGSRDLWGDEVGSLYLSLEPLKVSLVELATFEPHPPLYIVMLHYWTQLAGIGEFAVRFPSLICVVGAIPVAGTIGRQLAGRSAGLLAAAVVTLLPLAHWYAQEARMYAPLLFFGGWACLELLRAHEGRSSGRLRYVVVLLLAAYSHYYGLMLGVIHGAIVVGFLATQIGKPEARPAGRIRWWLPVVAGLTVGYLPWLLFAGRVVTAYQGVARGEIDVVPIARDIWLRYALGWSVEPPGAWIAAVPLLALASIGLLAGLVRPAFGSSRWATLTIGASVLGPVVLGALISLVRPMYAERYLVVGLIPFGVLLAVGIARLRTVHPLLGLAGLVVPVAFLGSLQNDALDPLYKKSEYRKLANIERALRGDDDKTLLVGGSQYYLHQYYAQPAVEPISAPEVPPFDPARDGPRLAQRLGDAPGVWLYLYSLPDYDPGRLAERWSDAHLFRGDHYWAANGELTYYGQPAGTAFAPRLGGAHGGDVQIAGVDVADEPRRSGDPLPVRMRYDAPPPPATRIALKLVDNRGMLWGSIDEPALGAGGEVRPGFVLRIAPGAPPGTYTLRFQVVGNGGLVTLQHDGREDRDLDLGAVQVVSLSDRFAGALVPAFRPLDGAVAGGRVLGVSGGEVGPPGGNVFVYLAWKAMSDAQPRPARFALAGNSQSWPVEWRTGDASVAANDVVVVQQNLAVPPELRAGTYRLLVVDDSGAQVELGPLRIGG